VRASAPIFSLVHCLRRSNFLLMFMVAGEERQGRVARGYGEGEGEGAAGGWVDLSIRMQVR
jgi:hypothetical protein